MSKAIETGEFDSVLTYNKYDLLTQEAREELIPKAMEYDVAVILGSPLHMGLLGARRMELIQSRPDFVSEKMLSKLPQLDHIAVKRGESISSLALRYLLSDPHPAVAIPATSRPEHVDDNVKVSDGRYLPKKLIREIESL